MVLEDKIKISDSENIFGTAYKNSVNDTMISSTKEKAYKNGQKSKVTRIAEIKHEPSLQLQYEQIYAEIKGKSIM